MAFVTISPTRTDADSPIDQSLMDDIRENLDDLDGARVTNGDAHNHDGGDGGQIPQDGLKDFATGSARIHASDTGRDETSTSYIKKKEILISRDGVLNVYFGLASSNPLGTAYGRIYKNGSPVGTERTTTTSNAWSEDITVARGDLLQLYSKVESPYTSTVSNFRLFNSFEVREITILD